MKKISLISFMIILSVQTFAQKEKKNFFNTYHMEATYIEQVYNIPYNISMAIAALQSGYGKSGIYKYFNNPFGLKNKDGSYKTYKNKQDAFIDFAETVNKKVKPCSNFREYTISIKESIYKDQRPDWSGEVIRIIIENRRRLCK